MEDSCGKLLALKVMNNTPAFVASPSAYADEKVGAFGSILGVRWTKELIKSFSGREGSEAPIEPSHKSKSFIHYQN